jgi:hypothetical protein
LRHLRRRYEKFLKGVVVEGKAEAGEVTDSDEDARLEDVTDDEEPESVDPESA